jgi:hypothetical protein
MHLPTAYLYDDTIAAPETKNIRLSGFRGPGRRQRHVTNPNVWWGRRGLARWFNMCQREFPSHSCSASG